MSRANPFSASRFAPGALPWIGDGDLDRYLGAICVRGARFQIVGPHGSGKSTLLAHLERGARARGWDVLRFRASGGFVFPPRGALVLADEAEVLGAIGRRILRASATALVMTGHRDLGVPTLCERRMDVPTLGSLVSLLDPHRAYATDSLAALLARHDGNAREVFFSLYDDVERARRDRSAAQSAP